VERTKPNISELEVVAGCASPPTYEDASQKSIHERDAVKRDLGWPMLMNPIG
jgi:hypothetical protein